MWVLFKDFLLVSMGMGIGIVLMCILNVGKEADYVSSDTLWSPLTTLYNRQLFHKKSTIISQ